MKSGSLKKSTASKSVIVTVLSSAGDAVGFGEREQRVAIGGEYEAGLDRLVGVGRELLLVLVARRVELLQPRIRQRFRGPEQQADHRRVRAWCAGQCAHR